MFVIEDRILDMISKLIKTRPQKGRFHFDVWFTDEWVVKKPKEGKDNEQIINPVDPKEILKNLEKLANIGLQYLHIPKTYYIKKHNVLLQQRIKGRTLNKLNEEDKKVFLQLKSEFDTQKKIYGLPLGKLVLQDRNIVVDQYGRYWLVDPD